MGRRKRGRRGHSMTIPLAPVLGLAAGLADPARIAMEGDFPRAIAVATQHYTGYDPVGGTWSAEALKKGLLPLVIGMLVHKFVGGPPLNLNRMLGQAKVPFIRI